MLTDLEWHEAAQIKTELKLYGWTIPLMILFFIWTMDMTLAPNWQSAISS